MIKFTGHTVLHPFFVGRNLAGNLSSRPLGQQPSASFTGKNHFPSLSASASSLKMVNGGRHAAIQPVIKAARTDDNGDGEEMSQDQILIKIEQNEAQLRKLMRSVLTKYHEVTASSKKSIDLENSDEILIHAVQFILGIDEKDVQNRDYFLVLGGKLVLADYEIERIEEEEFSDLTHLQEVVKLEMKEMLAKPLDPETKFTDLVPSRVYLNEKITPESLKEKVFHLLNLDAISDKNGGNVHWLEAQGQLSLYQSRINNWAVDELLAKFTEGVKEQFVQRQMEAMQRLKAAHKIGKRCQFWTTP